jgi:hypothetical protein
MGAAGLIWPSMRRADDSPWEGDFFGQKGTVLRSLKTLQAGKPGATARTTITKKKCRESASMRTEDQKRLLSEQSFGDVS